MSQRTILARPGDLNAFFGLMLDNMTQLVILSGILIGVFGFPQDLVLYRIVPGSAVGVVIGNLAYSALALRLARQSGRSDVTAMPIGIDTVSLFGFSFGVIGPAYLVLNDAERAWHVASAAIVVAGLVKVALALPAARLRRLIPRAGLLGPIAAIAIALIAFFPSLKLFHDPIVGFFSLAVILACLVGQSRLPWNIPAAFGAVATGIAIYYGLDAFGLVHPASHGATASLWEVSMPLPSLAFLSGLGDLVTYLPLMIPFVIGVVIGDVDVTESAEAAGDHYPGAAVIGFDGLATLAGGLCGGVLQTTAYIGHPAYKRMGGGAGYTLGTAIFIGMGAALGFLSGIVSLIPEAVVAPILIFVGLEITAQAFFATPVRHHKALALAFLPILAQLVLIQTNSVLGNLGQTPAALSNDAASTYQAVLVLANGFIVTSLIWASATSHAIDGRMGAAAGFMATAAVAALVGVIHSPFPDGRLFWPWAANGESIALASAYVGAAAVFLLLGQRPADRIQPST